MSSPDPISLVALIVSLIALILTLLQVAQQYLGTASDYRHCSERSVGGWHRKCWRQFIWSELRFEVYFATPVIQVSGIPARRTNSDHYAVPTMADSAQYILHTSKGDKIHTSSENPWFLDLHGTRPEAQCTWLSLLNDATITHLQIDIDQHTRSYDFMPDGIKKPLARMDRKSFLTLMSLFQVSWQEGWRVETGGKGGGKRETPSGAGPYCEITSRNVVNFGTVISYRRLSDDPSPYRFYIFSEKARSAMFNRFDLGFHVALTHTSEEVYSTTSALADKNTAKIVQSFYDDNYGYAPGLAEVIACFAEPEMPKAIQYGTDEYVSIFSARSCFGSIFDSQEVGQLLLGSSNIANSNEKAGTFAKWAENYIPFLSRRGDMVGLPADQLQEALRISSSYFGKETQERKPISWYESRKCLGVIKVLDEHLTTLCRLLAPNLPEPEVHREFAKLQIRHGCTLYSDADKRAEDSKGFWREFVGVVVAQKYTEICAGMMKYPGSDDKGEVIQIYVINRLMRGLLWRIHNGNCPTNANQDERLLECSLNSHWLSDASSLWID